MPFTLPPLPYAANALEPHLSQRTMELHHGKHHDAYVTKLNALVGRKRYASMTLEEVLRATARGSKQRAIFNNAAQAWNHEFFWHGMKPGGGGRPGGALATRLEQSFGGFDAFRGAFVEAAVGQFGSGWAWLVLDGADLAVEATANAANPLTAQRVPLLVCDVWEHAYYLDYQNRRQAFVEAFLDHLVDWERVATRLAEASLEGTGAAQDAEPQRRAA